MRVFVTGGLGYVGSHTCAALLEAGHEVVLADNLSNASPSVLERIIQISGRRPEFYPVDVADGAALRRIFAAHRPEAVLHFAGFKVAEESLHQPLRYYRNNLEATLCLLEVMEEFSCKRLVFSSSAAVYGPENPVPYTEEMPAHGAESPYGRSKAMIEQILRDVCAADVDFSAVLLRYFNPIGGHASGLLGDAPQGRPSNLMPYIVRVAAGTLREVTVFGDDYPTADGTGLRDYLHVEDLAQGHLKALDYANGHTGATAFNLGTGKAISVLELIRAFESATGRNVPFVVGPRREGDLAAAWADVSKAARELHWTAQRTVEEMCRDSWHFAQRSEE